MIEIAFLVFPFFILVLAGYGAARLGVLEQGGVLGLNRFVYFFALPALLFGKMAATPFAQITGESVFALAHVGAGLLVFAFAWLAVKHLFKAERKEQAVTALGASYGNIGFLGIPLLVSVLGAEVAAPLSIMLLLDIAFFIEAYDTDGKTHTRLLGY